MQRGFKNDAFAFEVSAQLLGLLLAQRAQQVVVVGTKRGLAMAHKIKGSHAPNLRQLAPRAAGAMSRP